jgi:hypothetical protein
VAIRERSKDRFTSVNEDLRMSLAFGLRIWKASAFASSRIRIPYPPTEAALAGLLHPLRARYSRVESLRQISCGR